MLQNIPKEKILEIVKQGPTIPQKIVKIVGGDTMLIGAILSTMISTGEVQYSTLKIGGSPLYYILEHEAKLEEYLSYLNEKDQKTAKLLKERKILKDSEQDPLTRVSLKTIKDFARPFEIDKQLFYRYFLTSKEDAEVLVKEIFRSQIIVEIEEKKPQEVIANTESSALDKAAAVQHAMNSAPVDIKSSVDPERISFAQKKTAHKTEAHSKKDFLEIIKEHVHKLNLDIISKEKIKKSEYILILKNHDSNEYIYCVAKDKKTINEGDLSTVFVFSHQKKMPCIFFITGRLTKKAEVMSQKEFKDMKIEKI